MSEDGEKKEKGNTPPFDGEKDETTSFTGDIVGKSYHGLGIVGLTNLGNTSYINSILQCLSNCAPLTEHFLSGAYQNELNTTNPLGSGGKLAVFFGELLQRLWCGNTLTCRPSKIKKQIGEDAPHFLGYQQQDSFEFLCYLLHLVHEDINLSTIKPYIEEKEQSGRPDGVYANGIWNNFKIRNDSFIINHFFHLVKSTVRCDHTDCKDIRTNFNPQNSITLPIPKSSANDTENNHHVVPSFDLKDCFTEYLKEKQLDATDKWHCNKCRQNGREPFRQSYLKNVVFNTPHILILRFNRFSLGQQQVGQQGMQARRIKDETFISYPINGLNLEGIVKNIQEGTPPPIYDLFAVSVHCGGLGGGHDISYCKNPITNKWYTFDDSNVSEIKDMNKIITKNAYILFYKRCIYKTMNWNFNALNILMKCSSIENAMELARMKQISYFYKDQYRTKQVYFLSLLIIRKKKKSTEGKIDYQKLPTFMRLYIISFLPSLMCSVD